MESERNGTEKGGLRSLSKPCCLELRREFRIGEASTLTEKYEFFRENSKVENKFGQF